MFWDVFYSVLALFTGIGVFLVGIVLFSESLERNASKKMKRVFDKISTNRFAGFGVGTGATAVMQSSTATSVMTIGLVNAGILSLFQATAIVIGANVGATVSVLMVSLSSLKIKYFFMALVFIGAFMKIIIKKDGVKRVADLMISFGILFVGLELMSSAFASSAPLQNLFMDLFANVTFPLLLILLSFAFTAIIQSSTAASAIYMSMMAGGMLPFSSAMYLIIGAKIGTTVTAVIASLTSSTNAKRTALIHVLFNVISGLMFLIVLWPLEGVFANFYTNLIPDPVWQYSIFFLITSIIPALILIWFIKPLNNFTAKIIKDNPNDESVLRTYFIQDSLLTDVQKAIEMAFKEINHMAVKSRENLDRAFNLLIWRDFTLKTKVLKEEERLNFLHQAITRYLTKLAALPLGREDKKKIGSLRLAINDIERIGDRALRLMGDAITMREHKVKFNEFELEELSKMYTEVANLFVLSLEIFNTREESRLKEVAALGKTIDRIRINLADVHVEKLSLGESAFEAGGYFYSGVMCLQRISDHIMNIAFSLRPQPAMKAANFLAEQEGVKEE